MNFPVIPNFLFHPGAPHPSAPSPRPVGHRDGILTYRNYLKFPWADTAGWYIRCLHFVHCLLLPSGLLVVMLLLLWPVSLLPNLPPTVFLICPWLIFQPFWFFTVIFHSIPDPCVLNLLFTSLSLKPRFLPRSCLNILISVCLWSQWPVAHLPTWLWLFIPAYFSSPSFELEAWAL